MLLSDIETRAALYAVDDLIRQRRIRGMPIPPPVLALHRSLIAASMSSMGQATIADPQGSAVNDPISSGEAAVILGCTQRHMRRLHADLGARRVGARWVFSESAVIEYRDGRNAAD